MGCETGGVAGRLAKGFEKPSAAARARRERAVQHAPNKPRPVSARRRIHQKIVHGGQGPDQQTFNASAAFRNYKRAAAAVINATKSGDDALLRTVPARTGIGMLPAPQLDTLRVPRDGIAAVGLGSDLAAPPLAMCGAGVGICGPGLCCSQAGFCARDSYSCDGTCQRAYSGMDAPCNGKFPDPVPKGDWTEAAPGGVCGAYVGKYCG